MDELIEAKKQDQTANKRLEASAGVEAAAELELARALMIQAERRARVADRTHSLTLAALVAAATLAQVYQPQT